MKTEVYSWRMPRRLKSDLERAARGRKMRVSAILESAVREGLNRYAVDIADDEEQRRLHAATEAYLGVFRGKNPRRAETVRELIRKRLRRRYGRR